MGTTLYDKIWDAHLVEARPGETPLIYVDRHLVHEVTSPQAFEGLRNTGRKVRRRLMRSTQHWWMKCFTTRGRAEFVAAVSDRRW